MLKNINFRLVLTHNYEWSHGLIKDHILGTKPNDTFGSRGRTGGGTSDDIIELQDVRMSPIASIKNRHNTKGVGVGITTTPGDVSAMDPSKFPPSFRISRTEYSFNQRNAAAGLRYRGNRGKHYNFYLWNLLEIFSIYFFSISVNSGVPLK